MTRPDVQAAAQPSMRPRVHLALPERPSHLRVWLAFVEQRVQVWLRFGRSVRVAVPDCWRHAAVFEPGAVCCCVKGIAVDRGMALWQLVVRQAPMPFGGVQWVAGVVPGARVLLCADGERQVAAVVAAIDVIEASGADPCAGGATYWCKAGDRFAAGQPLPSYMAERHAEHLVRGALR